MKVRSETGFRFATNTEANLALLTLARLVKSGQLPAGTKATDPVSPQVLERFTAQHPTLPAPKDVGELLLAFAGDSDADGNIDLDLAALAETSLITLDVPVLETAQQLVLTADEFVAVGAGHATLMPAVDPATLVAYQSNVYDEVEISAPATEGLVSYLRSAGQSQLTLTTPLTLDASGKLGRGPGTTPELRQFDQATLSLSDSGLMLTLTGSSGTAWLTVSASGRTKSLNSTTSPSIDAAQSKWLLDALLATVDASKSDPAFKQVADVFAKNDALHRLTTPPTDPAERAVWAGGHLSADELQARVTKLQDTWGVRPLRWQGWVDDPSEVNTARTVLEATGGQTAIRPSFLYTIAIGEGLLYYLDDNNHFTHVDTTQPVSGFGMLGTDTFASAADGLKRSGLLPAWFQEGRDYTVDTQTNEKGEAVRSANFPDLKRGLIALRAMLADSRQHFLNDAKTVLGPTKAAHLTQDQVDYFTYVYFNAGAGFGKRHLQSQGLAAVKKWEGTPPPDNRIARFNALQRLSTQQLMDSLQLFPAKSPLPAPVG
jgi:hypothetical protein